MPSARSSASEPVETAPIETCRVVVHLHDGALAELPLDVPEGGVQSLLAIHFHQPPRANDSRTTYCAPPDRSTEW